jgi:hypothetical protein
MEIWKPIVTKNIDYTGRYEVSNLGRVKKLQETINASHNGKSHTRVIPEKILFTYPVSERYHVSLNNGEKPFNYCVHMLVAHAFIPNPKNSTSAHFIDDNPENLRADNIAWGYTRPKDIKENDGLIDLSLYRDPDPTGEEILREIMAY